MRFSLFPLYIVSCLESGMLHFFPKLAHTKSLIYLFYWDLWSDFWRDIPRPQDFKFCFHKISFVIQFFFLNFQLKLLHKNKAIKTCDPTVLFCSWARLDLVNWSAGVSLFYFFIIFFKYFLICLKDHHLVVSWFLQPQDAGCVHLWGGGGCAAVVKCKMENLNECFHEVEEEEGEAFLAILTQDF